MPQFGNIDSPGLAGMHCARYFPAMHNSNLSALDLPAGTRAVIFDMDGVLIDSWASTMHFFTLIRESVGLGEMSPEDREFCFVHTVEQSIRHMVPPELYPVAAETWKKMDWNTLIPFIKLQPGIKEYLEELKRSGVGTAVNTNGGVEQKGILNRLGLLDYFEMVVTAQDVAEGKPSPEGVERILAAFNLRPAQAVFIGDSHLDMEAARNAGVVFWAYGNQDLNSDRHLVSYI